MSAEVKQVAHLVVSQGKQVSELVKNFPSSHNIQPPVVLHYLQSLLHGNIQFYSEFTQVAHTELSQYKQEPLSK